MTEVKPDWIAVMQVAGLVAVVEMHADRNMRIDFGERVHHVLQHDVVGIGASAARGLHDHWRVDGAGRLHDRQRLLHIVDVEGGHAITVFGGVVEQLAKGDAGHVSCSPRWGLKAVLL